MNHNNSKSNLRNGAKSFSRILKYMVANNKVAWFFVVVCIVISAFSQMQGMVFIQSLVDDYIQPMLTSGSNDFSGLANALIKVAVIYIVGIIASFTYSRIMVNVTQDTMQKLRTDLFSNMEKLPIKYFDTHAHGDIMSVYTNDIDTMRQLISQSIPQIFNSVITLVFSLVAMIRMNIVLAGITVLMACVMLVVTRKFTQRSGRYFDKQQKALGEVDGFIEEMLDGQKVVKVFCHEEKAKADFDQINEQLRFSSYKANKYANMMMPVNVNIGNLSYVLCAAVGAALCLGVGGATGIAGATVGTVVAFMGLNKSFSMPIAQISQQMNSIIMAVAGTKRVFALFDEQPEEDHGYVEMVNAVEHEDGSVTEADHRTGVWAWKHPHQADGTVTYQKLEGAIVLDGVDFGYTDDKMVLHDIKLYAEPGQKIAFVGSTGAGKTTITNLINRFYDIQDGKIRYDGINITKIKKDDLRRSLGIVLQDTHLFTGTIRDNIRYGNLDATDEQIYEAARLAHADQFIRMLPNGYDTMLSGDGEELSQGQRQLLSIARAAVADPPVLILDEATSSIDTRTESIVQKGMDNLMKGRTVFVIAHRLSTIRNSDAIIVLDHGQIIERGDHADLIKQKGTYYQLYTGKLELS